MTVEAQAQTHQLSGYIEDAASGEMLLGATLWCESVQAGTGTNAYGFYSIALPTGTHQLTVSYIGYTPQTYEVQLSDDLKLDFELSAGIAIDEAVVTGEAFNRIEDQVQMSKMEIPMDQVRRLPAIGGDKGESARERVAVLHFPFTFTDDAAKLASGELATDDALGTTLSVPKYKQIAGSLKASFGVKRIVPTITIETARSLVVDDFSPAVAEPTVMRNVRQRSDDITQPNVVKKTEEKEADFKTKKAFRSVEQALQEEIDQGQVKVRIEDNKVVVELRDNQSSGGKSDASVGQGSGGPITQATIDIAAKVVDVQAKLATEVQVRKQKLATGKSKRGSENEESADKSPGGSTSKRNQDIENQYQKNMLQL